jgi:hypothetical protein
LSKNLYNKSKVEGLFESFKVEAKDTLLFVNHVTKISLKTKERWPRVGITNVLQVESEVVLGQDRKSDFVRALKSHSKVVEDEGGVKTLEISDDSEEATWSLKIKSFERNVLQGIHL